MISRFHEWCRLIVNLSSFLMAMEEAMSVFREKVMDPAECGQR